MEAKSACRKEIVSGGWVSIPLPVFLVVLSSYTLLVVYTLRFLVAAARFRARGFGLFLVSSNSPLNSRGM